MLSPSPEARSAAAKPEIHPLPGPRHTESRQHQTEVKDIQQEVRRIVLQGRNMFRQSDFRRYLLSTEDVPRHPARRIQRHRDQWTRPFHHRPESAGSAANGRAPSPCRVGEHQERRFFAWRAELASSASALKWNAAVLGGIWVQILPDSPSDNVALRVRLRAVGTYLGRVGRATAIVGAVPTKWFSSSPSACNL